MVEFVCRVCGHNRVWHKKGCKVKITRDGQVFVCGCPEKGIGEQ